MLRKQVKAQLLPAPSCCFSCRWDREGRHCSSLLPPPLPPKHIGLLGIINPLIFSLCPLFPLIYFLPGFQKCLFLPLTSTWGIQDVKGGRFQHIGARATCSEVVAENVSKEVAPVVSNFRNSSELGMIAGEF